MQKIYRIVFWIFLVLSVFSCGNDSTITNPLPETPPANPPENPPETTPEDQPSTPPAQTPIIMTSGDYIFIIDGDNISLEYTGTGNPKVTFDYYSIEHNYGHSIPHIYSKKICRNILEDVWMEYWYKKSWCPETHEMLIQIFENDNPTPIFMHKKEITIDQKFIDSKDYSKKTFVPRNMEFHEETAIEALPKIKMGININGFENNFLIKENIGDAPPNIYEMCCWATEFLSREKLHYLKSLGFTAVRLQATWWLHLDDNNNIYPGWLNRIQEVIDWCMDENMYVILNSHFDSTGGSGDSSIWMFANADSWNTYNDRYRRMWEQIADRFKNYGEKLIFSGPNEVSQNSTWNITNLTDAADYLNKWNQLFIDTVRKSDGHNNKRNLVISALNGSCTVNYTKKVNVIDTVPNHLILDMHYYQPYEYTHACFQDNRIERFEDINSQKLIDDFKWNISELKKENNIPIIIGEWGIGDGAFNTVVTYTDADKAKYAETFISEFMKHGIPAFMFWAEDNLGMNYIVREDNPNPLFLKAVYDASYNTDFGQYHNYKYNGKIDKSKLEGAITLWQSGNYNTNGLYTNDFKLTQYFYPLPQKGDFVEFSFDAYIDADVKKLQFYLVDDSEAVGWFKPLSDSIYIDVQKNETFAFNYKIPLTESPVRKINLRVEYHKDDYDLHSSIFIQ